MGSPPLPSCLVWPVQAWPEIDQHLWRASLEAGDRLDPVYVDGLSEATIVNARKSYGRWLAVLSAAGELDALIAPADRVTRPRAKLFLRALRHCGNSNNAIRARFWALRSALRVLQPAEDFGWLTSWLNLLPVKLRAVEAFDSAILEAWGHDLMRNALKHPEPLVRQTQYRNGLLIAILATRAPRVRSIAAMRLGRQIIRTTDGGWQLSFKAEDVKTRRPVEYGAPSSLIGSINRYLEIERQELLQGRQHDWFWVSRYGERVSARGIEAVIRRASYARFGKTFGPHRFRHSLATTAAYADPSNSGLAASLLAISETVVEVHYNMARQDDALRRFQENLRKERALTARQDQTSA